MLDSLSSLLTFNFPLYRMWFSEFCEISAFSSLLLISSEQLFSYAGRLSGIRFFLHFLWFRLSHGFCYSCFFLQTLRSSSRLDSWEVLLDQRRSLFARSNFLLSWYLRMRDRCHRWISSCVLMFRQHLAPRLLKSIIFADPNSWLWALSLIF